MSNPYIITTRTVNFGASYPERAVATLEKARVYVTEIGLPPALLADNYDELREQFDAIREHGGTVGPLPNGDVIEVVGGDRADAEMRLACPFILTSDWLAMSVEERCAAYNAKYAKEES